MLFHEAFAQALIDNGVTTVYGLVGDANVYLMDSFERTAGGRHYAVAHETAAVLAATGHAQATGGVGVATVTQGPGLTNTVTALIEAVRERMPIVVVAGDTAAVDRDNPQNIDHRSIVLPTGAGFEQVRSPDTVGEDVGVAVRRALTERRPVVLNVPFDFQWQETEYQGRGGSRWVAPQDLAPSADSLDGPVGVIASAKRPVILAGRGAQSDESRRAVIRLGQRIGAPLSTTLRARDLFEGEPHNLRIFGTLSHELALGVIDDADCVIALGASLNKWTAAEGALLAGKAVIQVDNDQDAIGRSFPVTHGVHGSAGAVADAIVAMLDDAEMEPTNYASPALAERIAARTDADYVDSSTSTTVDHRTAMRRIDAAFPPDRALVFDVGRFLYGAYTLFHVEHPSLYHHTGNFGSIGLGMGNALGAAVGSGRPTLVVAGDGGFMLGGLAEFNTAVRHNLDIVVVVFNDGAYGSEHILFRNRSMDPGIALFEWPDFATVATALGGTGYTVRNLDELDTAIAALPDRKGPVLIDVRIDPDLVSAK